MYGEWVSRARKATHEAHAILSLHESSPSRVVLLEELIKKLSGTPIDVQEYFKESIKCLESGLFRAAVVFSWAGHFDVYSEYLFRAYETDIKSIRKNWSFKDVVELRENYAESQILDVGKEVNFIKKSTLRILQGQLSQRNSCAHPTMYKPSMNATIGYVDQMVSQSLSYMNLSN